MFVQRGTGDKRASDKVGVGGGRRVRGLDGDGDGGRRRSASADRLLGPLGKACTRELHAGFPAAALNQNRPVGDPSPPPAPSTGRNACRRVEQARENVQCVAAAFVTQWPQFPLVIFLLFPFAARRLYWPPLCTLTFSFFFFTPTVALPPMWGEDGRLHVLSSSMEGAFSCSAQPSRARSLHGLIWAPGVRRVRPCVAAQPEKKTRFAENVGDVGPFALSLLASDPPACNSTRFTEPHAVPLNACTSVVLADTCPKRVCTAAACVCRGLTIRTCTLSPQFPARHLPARQRIVCSADDPLQGPLRRPD